MTLRQALVTRAWVQATRGLCSSDCPTHLCLHQLGVEARAQALSSGGSAARPEAGHCLEPVGLSLAKYQAISLEVALLTHKFLLPDSEGLGHKKGKTDWWGDLAGILHVRYYKISVFNFKKCTLLKFIL